MIACIDGQQEVVKLFHLCLLVRKDDEKLQFLLKINLSIFVFAAIILKNIYFGRGLGF